MKTWRSAVEVLAREAEREYAVVAEYNHAGLYRGDIISMHRTYAGAERSIKRTGWESYRSVRHIADYEGR